MFLIPWPFLQLSVLHVAEVGVEETDYAYVHQLALRVVEDYSTRALGHCAMKEELPLCGRKRVVVVKWS